jgi:hypothetical protein
MTHRKSIKEDKPMDNKSRRPEVVHEEETEKHKSKGLIRGTREQG